MNLKSFSYILLVISLKKTLFIKNAAILTVSGFVLRFIGIIFKVWLTNLIGSEGIGLYQLVFSVYVLASTFATSGISTAVTRLCTDELALGTKKKVKKILKYGFLISFAVAVLSVIILFLLSPVIAKKILFAEKAELPIKVMCFSLPFMGCCSCLRGYFIARRKATPPAISGILEQLVRIAVIFVAIKFINTEDIGIRCSAIMLGDVVSEALSCLFLFLIYCFDIKKLKSKAVFETKTNITAKIKEIAVPISSGRYLNSLLRTTENILVPKALQMFGSSVKASLSAFGMIKGMALPLLFFPSTLLNSISTLLLPELSEADVKKQFNTVKCTVCEVVSVTAVVSYLFSALFFVCGREIGFLIYKNIKVGNLLRYLSPIIPLMYLDSICDGMLKGLNEQKFTFKISILDSSIRILLVLITVPLWGIKSFIGIMYFSNFFTGFLNTNRLLKKSKASISFSHTVFFPLLTAFLTVTVISNLCSAFINSNLVYIILVTLFSTIFYSLFIYKNMYSKTLKL